MYNLQNILEMKGVNSNFWILVLLNLGLRLIITRDMTPIFNICSSSYLVKQWTYRIHYVTQWLTVKL